ncbi:MAG: NADH-quinone oxidoreductase subunit J [Phycisphaerae bacterium]|nr:NADH-quinone oxidoreductase subunit J [Phycisphaerae bacterium]
MGPLINPWLLYGLCAVGAAGVALALPRRGVSPQVVGAGVGGAGLLGVFAALGVSNAAHLPNLHFYLFSAIALGSALRVITHPRPVYAALFFVLTILASCGLYIVLGAEFMGFALVIVYAGAILITYLFVIMLATQAPTADRVDALSEYDRVSREPLVATIVGFLMVGALTGMMARGVGTIPAPAPGADPRAGLLMMLPGKVERELRERALIGRDDVILTASDGLPAMDLAARTVRVGSPGGAEQRTAPIPADVRVSNVEGLAFELIANHPGAIEIAGVILLMAMLGAVVLARKKVDLDEHERPAAFGPGGGHP